VDGACLPPHRPFSVISGIGATGRGIAPTKNETALTPSPSLEGNRIYWLASLEDGKYTPCFQASVDTNGYRPAPEGGMGKFRKREKGIRKSFGYYFQFSVPSLIIIDDR